MSGMYAAIESAPRGVCSTYMEGAIIMIIMQDMLCTWFSLLSQPYLLKYCSLDKSFRV